MKCYNFDVKRNKLKKALFRKWLQKEAATRLKVKFNLISMLNEILQFGCQTGFKKVLFRKYLCMKSVSTCLKVKFNSIKYHNMETKWVQEDFLRRYF